MDVTSFLLGLAKGKASAGGGGSATHPIHTVTFDTEDGSAVLYQRSVVDGDDCADVVARGLLETPTKESTPQYSYTYSGWSLTPEESADADALDAVKADRTVYAAFTSAVRYYTITYYDEDGTTVLNTQSLKYGAMPSYTPTKDGYDFVAWIPEDTAVTGDMSYTATWKTKAAFETASWSEIASICDAGNAESTFELGNSRVETLTFADGTTEQITLVIVGFADRYVYDGTTSPSETSRLVLMTKNALSKTRQMNGSDAYWKNTAMYTYLNNDVYQSLPSDLRTIVKQRAVNIYVGIYKGDAAYVWTPTLSDLGASKNDFASYESQLSFFANDTLRIKKLGDNGAATEYWTSSTRDVNYKPRYAYITASGSVYGGTTNGGYASAEGASYGVVFGIII